MNKPALERVLQAAASAGASGAPGREATTGRTSSPPADGGAARPFIRRNRAPRRGACRRNCKALVMTDCQRA